MSPIRRAMTSPQSVVLPPFMFRHFSLYRQQIIACVNRNPHPTDLLLDTSVFSIDRLPLVRDILLYCSPILLVPVLIELEDLKTKPSLKELRDLVFPRDILNSRFKSDECGVLRLYSRFSARYASLLRLRRDVIDIEVRRVMRETGHEPVGKARARLIQTLLEQGMATGTIKLANKDYRSDRYADEMLAVFAVLSPIVTGRDCFLLTADKDVFEQVIRMSEMLFNDYGAYLMASDFQNDESRYKDRHPYTSPLFIGEAMAVGRSAHPDYLLPPPTLIKTCATTVIDVSSLNAFTWISARNMEAAISFQEQDPLGRRGDPGMGKSIIFSLPVDRGHDFQCDKKHHFAIGTPSLLRLSNDWGVGPIPKFDLFRAIMGAKETPRRRSRILSPFAEHQQRLLERAAAVIRRR